MPAPEIFFIFERYYIAGLAAHTYDDIAFMIPFFCPEMKGCRAFTAVGDTFVVSRIAEFNHLLSLILPDNFRNPFVIFF